MRVYVSMSSWMERMNCGVLGPCLDENPTLSPQLSYLPPQTAAFPVHIGG